MSAHGGHAAAERLPDDAVPLQRALAAPLQAAQAPTQWGERDPGGEQVLDRPAGWEEREGITSGLTLKMLILEYLCI